MAGRTAPVPDLDPTEHEQMMEYFTQQVQLLQEKARLQASVREEKKLLVENAKLKKDIDSLKRELQETQRRKAMKLHQEKVLTASVAAMKAAVTDVSVSCPPTGPYDPSTGPRAQSITHSHSEGRRRRDRRGAGGESARASELGTRVGSGLGTRVGSGLGTRVGSGPRCALEQDTKPDVSRLDLRIGRILAVRKHPESESLNVQEVDVGEPTPRTVVTGLANHVLPEQLQDSLAVLLCNVRLVKVRGVQSQARVLCAVNQTKMEPLAPPPGAQPGDRVTFQNYPGEAERELNPKQRVWERLLPDLHTDSRGVATYRGVAFEVRGKGLCRAPTIIDGGIK
ncbi:aminoacyl tRNA synthase complex-interacting multifunctional protein 1 [Electrophorus electricus]|uniref:aminoacyl tRNA synthase complex-interacting multifunctional protein 1 n=1 Tax=Electrophorus electricus TaxID=8005 RepID=UPI0015D09E71|nr:aminoacyl tRNA synthase complex-interacting multifunctional protein 1 [Electrophorus electricus]